MSTQFLIFNSEVTAQSSERLTTALIDAMNDEAITDITIGFSSLGGSVVHGINLSNHIRSCPKPTTIHAIGNVDSIGLTILVAGDTRYSVPNSRFLFHPINRPAPPTGVVNIPEMKQAIASISADESRLAAVWIERTNVSAEQAGSFFEAEMQTNEQWVLEHGFIEEIRNLSIPLGARVRHVI